MNEDKNKFEELKVFISWSGPLGQEIANLTKEFLSEIFDRKVEFFFSPRDMESKEWYSELNNNLMASRLCVCCVDKLSVDSLWMAYEVGEIKADRRKKVIPLLFGIDFEELKGPLRQIHGKKFSRNNIRRTVKEINDHLRKPLKESHLNENFSKIWGEYCDEIKDLLDVPPKSSESLNLINEIKKFLKVNSKKFELSELERERLTLYLDSFFEEAIGKNLLSICRSFDDIRKLDKANTNWDDLWDEYAFNILLKTAGQLTKISNREIPVHDIKDVRSFWKERIMKKVQNTLWTTNISQFGGSFGRDPDDDLIDVQREAIKERKVKITRVFIYQDNENENFSDLINLMVKQLDAGIKVRVLPQNKFEYRASDYLSIIGSSDFMILDNNYIYITKTNESKSFVTNTILYSDYTILKTAKEFSEIINSRSKEITKDNISNFPNLLERNSNESYQIM